MDVQYIQSGPEKKAVKRTTIAQRLRENFTARYNELNTPSISSEFEQYLKNRSEYVGKLLKGDARDTSGKLIWKWDDRIAAFKKEMSSIQSDITGIYSLEVNSYTTNKINQYIANIGKAIDVTVTQNESLKRKYDKKNSMHVLAREDHNLRNSLYSIMGAVNSIPSEKERKSQQAKDDLEKYEKKALSYNLPNGTIVDFKEDENTGRYTGLEMICTISKPSEKDKRYLKVLADKIEQGERNFQENNYQDALVQGLPLALVSDFEDVSVRTIIKDLSPRNPPSPKIYLENTNLDKKEHSMSFFQRRLVSPIIKYASATILSLLIGIAALNKESPKDNSNIVSNTVSNKDHKDNKIDIAFYTPNSF